MKIAPEYVSALALLIGAGFKSFGIEIENKILEGLIIGILSVIIAVQSFKTRGDISVLGIVKK